MARSNYINHGRGINFSFQQGNNVLLELTHILDDVVQNIETGYDILYGIYDYQENTIVAGRYSDENSRITRNAVGVYYLQFSHEDTKSLVGDYVLELSVVGAENSEVCHANQLIYIQFEARKNNRLT